MGQTTSSTLLSPDGWGTFQAGGGGSRVLQQASKGRLDLRELHPLLLLYTSHSGHSIVHVLAREGHAELLLEFVELLQQHAAELAEAVSSRLQEEDAKQAGAWWKPSQVLPWPRGPGDQVQQLQDPSAVVPTVLSWQNSKGVTPLMLACRAGHAACVAALLDNGADPLLVDKATRRSCLHYAAAAGHVSCVNVLLNEFRTLRMDNGNSSSSLVPLGSASVRDGVEGYTKFVDLRTNTGFSALHYTAFWGHTAVVRALLTGGASVMLQTANGGGRGCTELLVDAGSNALHLCAENGHVMVAATLLMVHAEAMAQRYAAPVQQQQQQQQQQRRQQQQQPWEGRRRQDPRAACNSTGRTPGALALAARRSKALLLLLDPALPLSWVLTAAGLMGSGLFGAPKLAVLAKAALDKHLVSCLDQLESFTQQKAEEQAAEQLAAPSIAAAAAICSAAAVAAAAAGAETSAKHDGREVEVTGLHAVPSNASLSLLAVDEDAAAVAAAEDGCNKQLECSGDSKHEDTPAAGCDAACCSNAAESGKSSAAAGSGKASCCMGSLQRSSSQTSIASSCEAATWPCSSSTACGSTSSGGSNIALQQAASVVDNSGDVASSCGEVTCNICFDAMSTAMVVGCRHSMCVGCARSIVTATTTVKPAACPFCRQGVAGFVPV